MKKIAILLLTCISTPALHTQLLLSDDFKYTGNLAGNGWWVHSGGTSIPVAITAGLTYAGYIGSGIGNAAGIFGDVQDVNKGFTNQSANGTVIMMSALINVPAANSVKATYFIHLGKRASPASFSDFCARVYAKTDGKGGVSFDLSNNQDNTNGTYSTSFFKKISAIANAAGQTQTRINLYHLAAGSYLLLFSNGNQQTAYSFIKQ